MTTGKLYVVATPIGNLEDITLRAIRILKEVDVIASEDTRTTAKLLSHYNIKKPLVAYFQHSHKGRLDAIIGQLLNGKNVALVSEAGTPAISDPGAVLVGEALRNGIEVVAIPGASSVTTALSVCGFSADKFVFEGFLPRKGGKRRKTLTALMDDERTLVFFESPHRILDTLEDMVNVLGDRRAVIARELTKIYEEIKVGHLAELLKYYTEKGVRGEFTIVVEGAKR